MPSVGDMDGRLADTPVRIVARAISGLTAIALK
jgi:hypothetical protein